MTLLREYYRLTKPGIIGGNLITAAAGFALASKGNFDFALFFMALLGLSFVVASGCVFNNYIDREGDEKMMRTRNRPFVKKTVSIKSALIFSFFLALFGFLTLLIFTNPLTTLIAFIGFFIYVFVYSFSKYRTTYATAIGSIAGAVPPVVGYCTVTNHYDGGAFLLFLIIILWQMPHFFSISMYRFNEYVAASIPVLPVKKGMLITKIHMLVYILAFITASAMLTIFGYTGYVYLAFAAVLGLGWLRYCIKGFKASNNTLWARKMFLYSLAVVVILCFMISIDVK